MINGVEFTVTLSEVMELPVCFTDLHYEQTLLNFMKEEKGLVCTGSVHLIPVGELCWQYDKKHKETHYWQYLDR